MKMAGLMILDSSTILDFIRMATRSSRDTKWWYDCYCHMYGDDRLNRLDNKAYHGWRLLPTRNGNVAAVPGDEDDMVVCLSPSAQTAGYSEPPCFSSVFVFLDDRLSQLITQGEDTVKAWVLDRFRIAAFEATELLPRAVRSVTGKLLSGETQVTLQDLCKAWAFIKGIIDSARSSIESTRFWRDIGRFPLPLEAKADTGFLDPATLCPAFFAYWPDKSERETSALTGVEDLPRVGRGFMDAMQKDGEVADYSWRGFFEKVGVSAIPKVLKYQPVIRDDRALHFTPAGVMLIGERGFSGERQRDENDAVVNALAQDGLWKDLVSETTLCTHAAQKVVQSLCLLQGLKDCALLAWQEYEAKDPAWQSRLWSLITGLPASLLSDTGQDTILCRGGSQGGHQIAIGSYVSRQLAHHPWLPSTLGPASNQQCFLRHSSRRLISSGREEEEIGDKLLPYVIVRDTDTQAKLEHLGVPVLDDPNSASTSSLVKALTLLGERLSTDSGRKEILAVKSRWRLVRGAIQEIYRALNQKQDPVRLAADAKLAVRLEAGVQFLPRPLYYAEPGSPVERAFLGHLPIIDADRLHQRLFSQLGIAVLTPGRTVEETLLDEDKAEAATGLRDEILNELAPHLLGLLVAKSESSRHMETAVRHLRDRFDVKSLAQLVVSFSIVDSDEEPQTFPVSKFHLKKTLVSTAGAVSQARFTLFTEGDNSISVYDDDFDGDALGQILSGVFLEGASQELSSVFPRIVSRYCQLRGDSSAMQDFMHRQLGVTEEAQEEAQDQVLTILSGETGDGGEPVAASPPPITIVPVAETQGSELQEKLEEQKRKIQEKAGNVVTQLTGAGEKDGKKRPGPPSGSGHPGITAEQERRGKRGEKEIKRRLQLPGGWEGFSLVTDKRDDRCGYDFLCTAAGREVKLEVKTFAPNGKVSVTMLEIQEAVASTKDYYLVGVLDDGEPPCRWSTFLIRSPAEILLVKGTFDIQARVEVPAGEVFPLSGGSRGVRR